MNQESIFAGEMGLGGVLLVRVLRMLRGRTTRLLLSGLVLLVCRALCYAL